MRTITPRRPHGPPALPRRILNPRLYDAVRECGRPAWQVATVAGLVHPATLGALVRARSVPDTPLNIGRLQRIAAAVGFEGEIFLDECER